MHTEEHPHCHLVLNWKKLTTGSAAEEYIPDFQAARTAKNMLERKAGQKDGFVCWSSAGRVVRLLQVYDSEIYPQEPEELPAQWGFVWSTDPD